MQSAHVEGVGCGVVTRRSYAEHREDGVDQGTLAGSGKVRYPADDFLEHLVTRRMPAAPAESGRDHGRVHQVSAVPMALQVAHDAGMCGTVAVSTPLHKRQGERGFEDPASAGIAQGTVRSHPTQQERHKTPLSGRERSWEKRCRPDLRPAT